MARSWVTAQTVCNDEARNEKKGKPVNGRSRLGETVSDKACCPHKEGPERKLRSMCVGARANSGCRVSAAASRSLGDLVLVFRSL